MACINKKDSFREYVIGQHWFIFIDEKGDCFIEFDVGHFASKFVHAKITAKEYRDLAKNFRLYNFIVNKIDSSEYIQSE